VPGSSPPRMSPWHKVVRAQRLDEGVRHLAKRWSGHHGPASRRFFSDFLEASVEGDPTLRLAFAAACLPHPDKVKRGGEDGYFACSASRSFGVADGVGGWADNGVDPGEFARQLLRHSHKGIRKSPSDSESDLQKALLDAATKLYDEQIQGGSTALLGQLCGTTLTILNLGDSGAMLLRPALRRPPGADHHVLFPRVVFRSSDQTHYFNCPYQYGSSSPPSEVPDIVRIRVRHGDLVIAATDGVFDNMFDHQVQALVANHLAMPWGTGKEVAPHLADLAMGIAKQAQRIGLAEDDKDAITPFALAAYSEGLSFRGGKLDDTTVVIGLVTNKENAPPGGADERWPSINNFR